MKVKVVRNWADASNAWIDVQTYTKLKLPPAGKQYKLSFIDKDGVPAQMIVTSDGASWVDGLGGGYKGKTILNMTIEEPQVGSDNGGGGGSFVFDGAVILLGEKMTGDGMAFYPVTLTLTLGGVPINTPAHALLMYDNNVDSSEFGIGVIDVSKAVVTPASGGKYSALYILSYNGQPDEPNIAAYLIGASDILTTRLCVLLPNGGIVVSDVMDFTTEHGGVPD